MSNTFGHFFRVTTFGESHGGMVGAVVDGCPSRLPLDVADIQGQLDRRRPGQTALSTPRKESDRVSIVSGLAGGRTLGTPITLLVRNTDARPDDYRRFDGIPRPSHADVTYRAKYGIAAGSGGGRASARETIGRVAAGAIAEKWLHIRWGLSIVAWVSAVGEIDAPELEGAGIDRAAVDRSPVRCPDAAAADAMCRVIQTVRDEGDSVGGLITCECRGVPPGWGEPVFGKLHAMLAAAQMSIPAARAFEIGAGKAAVRMRGSQHNDMIVLKENGRLGTVTNRSGGIQGGISNGEPIVFRVAFKPAATIARPQQTADYQGVERTLTAGGRHDPCVLPRAVPVVEAMAALVLADAARAAQTPVDDRQPEGTEPV